MFARAGLMAESTTPSDWRQQRKTRNRLVCCPSHPYG